MTELPQLSCNRCGECCIHSGPCMVRKFAGLPEEFEGRCEILKDEADGTKSCPLIATAKDTPSGQLWFAYYIDGTCSFPELRKEICVPV